MKVTRSYIKQLVKEELRRVLSEGKRFDAMLANEGLLGGYTEVSRLGNDDEKRAADSLKPMQYTFANVDDEYPTLIVKDENGIAYLSRATKRDPNKNEDLILKDLKPNGYKGVGIIGPNSHLR